MFSLILSRRRMQIGYRISTISVCFRKMTAEIVLVSRRVSRLDSVQWETNTKKSPPDFFWSIIRIAPNTLAMPLNSISV